MLPPLVPKLRELLHAHPFKPFKLKLVDGSEYTVPHEDFLSVTKSGSVIYDDGEKIYKTLNAHLILEVSESIASA